ncbi:MAG: Stage III sporulation protein AE precursor [Firmicutes bacterium ADurb.Bin182]|nr:MAG: Stage III sporulation protein AE precursor [Firmicutes bacterium ADurb.Bin182]
MNMRQIIIVFAVLCCLLFAPKALAETAVDIEIANEIKSQVSNSDIHSWQSVLDSLSPEVKEIWGSHDISELVENFAYTSDFASPVNIIDVVMNIFTKELASNIWLLAKVLAIALLSGLINALGGESEANGIRDIAGFVCYCLAVGVIVTQYISAVTVGKEAIAGMSDFIGLALPVLTALLSATGSIAASGVFQPAMALLSGSVAAAIESAVLPVILAGGVLAIVNNITERVQLNQLFSLSKTAAKWMIGLIFTVYFGVISVQGMSANAIDGVSIRTAKYALDKFIPIVGSAVSGTMDTVIGCALIVKNAAGITAMVLTFGILMPPLIKIAGTIFVFRIAAALCEPIGETKLSKMMVSVAEISTYLFAVIMALGVMFMITAGLMMATGSMGHF